MRYLYVSTIRRGAPVYDSGKLYRIDLDRWEVDSSLHLPEPSLVSKNPRGGARGVRGLAIMGDVLYAAGYDNIARVDLNAFILTRAYWSQECFDIHQIHPTANGNLRVLSTANDRSFLFSEEKGFRHEFDFSEYYTNDEVRDDSDTLHVNATTPDGRFTLFSLPGVIFEMSTKKQWKYDLLARYSHDLCQLPTGEIAFNESKTGRTLAFNLETTEYRVLHAEADTSLVPFGGTAAQRGWVRGMHYLRDTDEMYIGSSPAKVIHLGSVCSKPIVLHVLEISQRPIDAVFSVLVG